jgi:hypothetical protein
MVLNVGEVADCFLVVSLPACLPACSVDRPYHAPQAYPTGGAANSAYQQDSSYPPNANRYAPPPYNAKHNGSSGEMTPPPYDRSRHYHPFRHYPGAGASYDTY